MSAESAALLSAEVHLHLVDLAQADVPSPDWLELLSDDERARTDRYHFDRDRRRFIRARCALRTILGEYLEVEPRRLRFDYSPLGKPSLAAEFGGDLRFNLSHSHELALIAVTRGTAVGVDIEHLRPMSDMAAIVGRFFSSAERQAFEAVAADQQIAAFFRCWTRKEAYLKALGEGMSRALDSFDVTLSHEEPAELLHDAIDHTAPARWRFTHLEPAPNYIGACVVEGERVIRIHA